MDNTTNIGQYLSEFVKRVDTEGLMKYEYDNPNNGIRRSIPTQVGFVISASDLTLGNLVDQFIAISSNYETAHKAMNDNRVRASSLQNAMNENAKIIVKAFYELCDRNGIGATEFDEVLEEINGEISNMKLSRKIKYNVTVTWKPEITQEITVEAFDEEEAGELAIEEFSLYNIELRDYFDESDLETDAEEE